MNTPGIEFGRKTSAAYAALCKPLCQKLHLPQTAFDILMFLANNPGYQTASDVVEVRKLKANLVSVNVDRLVQEGYLPHAHHLSTYGPLYGRGHRPLVGCAGQRRLGLHLP